VAIFVTAGATLLLAWYLLAAYYNRKQAARVLHWIEAALAGKGEVVCLRWMGASTFHVALRLSTSAFQHPGLLVRLRPREVPPRWLLDWWRGKPATATFEADLDVPPGFNLEVHRHRWCGRTRRHLTPHAQTWDFEPTTPLIMTSRRKWQREATGMMHALLSCREREFLSLAFHRRSPHFAATVTLESIFPSYSAGSNLFDMLRELAAGASTSRL